MRKINQWLKKRNVFFMAAGFAVLSAGVSLALFTDGETKANMIRTGKVDITVEETLSGLEQRNIAVSSTGRSPCYVRMRVNVPVVAGTDAEGTEWFTPAVTYMNGDGSYSVDGKTWNECSSGTVIRPGENSSPDVREAQWVKMDDGYWYLSEPLETGERAVLCDKVNFRSEVPAGISKDQLSVIAYAEAIQLDNVEVDGESGADAAYAAFRQLKKN